MGNCLFLHARGWGIDCQVRTKLQIPGVCPGGMVTGRIEPCITNSQNREKPALFCACEQQSSCALTRGMNFDHFMAVGARDSF